jgi:hypothetical protein
LNQATFFLVAIFAQVGPQGCATSLFVGVVLFVAVSMAPSLLRQACVAKASPPSKTIRGQSTRSPKYAQREESSQDHDDIAKVVERNIQRFFGKTVPAAAIDVVQIDGKNMRARMIEDRAALLAGGRIRADPNYFRGLKSMYMAALLGTASVAATDESGDLPEGLKDAMGQARASQRRNRKREPLVHYLWQCREPLNQRSVIELVDLLVETQQHNCLKQAMLTQEIFATFARLNMLDQFPNEIAPAKPILEQCLITIYNSDSKSQKEYGFDLFWQKYKKTACLFLSVPFVERVLAETEDWAKCTPELSALATGSQLGTELFIQFCPAVIGAHINQYMKDTVLELRGVDITSATVTALVAKMLAEADRLKVDRLVPARDCSFQFMDDTVTLRMTTAVEQARHHVSAAIKTIAVEHGLLPQMSVEADVDPKKVNVAKDRPEIAAELLQSFEITRALMDTEALKTTLATPALWSEFFHNKRGMWFLQDPTFELEIQHVRNLAGPLGGKLLVRQALAMLPTAENNYMSYSVVAINLRKLEAQKAWLFAAPAARGIVTAILEIVVAMERGEGPSKSKFPAGTDMEAVGARLAFFCHSDPMAAAGSDDDRVLGAKAAAMNLKKLSKVIQDKTLSDLSPVTNSEVFRWLLSDPDAEILTKLGKEAYGMVLARVPGAKSAGLSDAMDVMVAAASSAKAAKASKKVTASKAKLEPASAKKKAKKGM